MFLDHENILPQSSVFQFCDGRPPQLPPNRRKNRQLWLYRENDFLDGNTVEPPCLSGSTGHSGQVGRQKARRRTEVLIGGSRLDPRGHVLSVESLPARTLCASSGVCAGDVTHARCVSYCLLACFGSWMVSFGIGAALVTLGAFASASVARLLEGQRPPALHWQVMRVPGSIAGTLWAIANFCGIAAVARGGSAVVMAQMQATQLVTSGLWGILWYKEIHGQARSCCSGWRRATRRRRPVSRRPRRPCRPRERVTGEFLLYYFVAR